MSEVNYERYVCECGCFAFIILGDRVRCADCLVEYRLAPSVSPARFNADKGKCKILPNVGPADLKGRKW